MVADYIPDRGHIIWMDFDPQMGHEQAGIRPALVLSRSVKNLAPGLLTCCPITGRQKGYTFEVPLPGGLEIYGVVLVDQIRSIDWRARQVEYRMIAPASVMFDVVNKLDILLR